MSGIELILAGVSFPVAAVTTLELFQKAVEHFAAKVTAYQNADHTVQDFLVLGIGLQAGFGPLNIDLLKWAYTHNQSEHLRNSLDRQLQNLQSQLIKAETLLNKLLNNDGSVRKKRFFFQDAERQLKECADDLRQWQIIFTGTIGQIRQHQDLKAQISLLDPSRFAEKPTLQNATFGGEISGGPYFRIAVAEFKSPEKAQPLSVTVLIEPQVLFQADKARLSDLAQRLGESKPGLLRCLGYRTEPNAELIFKLPDAATPKESLWRHISSHRSAIGSPATTPPSLSYRFGLGKQLARAVMSTHVCDIVHKNIRSDTIMIMAPNNGAGGPDLFGVDNVAVFTEWTAARMTNGLTNVESGPIWRKDVYRHPDRQGLTVDERYKLGYDIYSLGACLLEIGLWDTLVVEEANEFRLSKCVMDIAIDQHLLREEDRTRSERCLEPIELQSVLVELAEKGLPSLVGSIYTDVVKSCLTSMEGGLGDVADFNDVALIGAKFNEIVIAALESIRV